MRLIAIFCIFALSLGSQPATSAGDYADFSEYWFIFNQIIGEASQTQKIAIIYPKVIRELKEFIKKNPNSRWAAEAKLRIAEIYNLSGIVMLSDRSSLELKPNKDWFVHAKPWLLDIAKNHPDLLQFDGAKGVETDQPIAAQALYYLGIWSNDISYLKQLAEKYPRSKYGQFVAQNLETIAKHMDAKGFYQHLTQEIATGRKELAKIELKHSPNKVKCVEIRRRNDGQETKYTYYDFAWKEIALKLMNLENGQTRIIKARKTGSQLRSLSAEFIVTIEQRPSGILWNGRNTAYKVTAAKNSAHWAVILNRCPAQLKNGKRRDVIYAPYSTILHQAIIVREGEKFLQGQILRSLIELGYLTGNSYQLFIIEAGVSNLIVNGTERLVLIEHVDYFEFKEFNAGRWPHDPYGRVRIILALNGPDAFSSTSSPARASGLMQFTNRSRRRKPGTWDLIKQKYAWARLPSFDKGVASQIESIKAADLLQDFNVKILHKAFGHKILSDPNLEHYLAAMYNGGGRPVVEAIAASQRNNTDWRQELRKRKKTNESIEYLEKLDYLLKSQPNQ